MKFTAIALLSLSVLSPTLVSSKLEGSRMTHRALQNEMAVAAEEGEGLGDFDALEEILRNDGMTFSESQ